MKSTKRNEECKRRLNAVLDAVKLNAREKTRDEVAKITGLSNTTTYRYLQRLVKDGEIQSRIVNGKTENSLILYCFLTTETKLMPGKIEKPKKLQPPKLTESKNQTMIIQNTGSGQFGEPQNRVPANMRSTYQTNKATLNKPNKVVYHGAGASKKTGGGKCTAGWSTPFEVAK